MAISTSNKKELYWEIAFVIPAYNESWVIQKTIQVVLDAGYTNIIVVNDGSKDKTLPILEEFWDKIILLSHLQNRGQGAAIETWFEYLRRYGEVQYVCTFDSDGQHDIHDIKKFLKVFEEHPKTQIVFGSRFLWKQSTKHIPFVRRCTLKLWKLFTLLFSNISLTDTHNGYRVMRLNSLDDIKITIDTMGHASEIIDIVATKKIPYKEASVYIHYDEYTLKKWQKSSNAFNIALRFLWNKFFK